MSTRSSIAIKNEDGTVSCIYCHFDGYLTGVGKTLQEFYQDSAKINELISLGDLSILGKEIGIKRPFDNPFDHNSTAYRIFEERYKDQCRFYGRDRGESDTGPTVSNNVSHWLHSFGQSYNYPYIDGIWFVSTNEIDSVGFPVLTELEAEMLIDRGF